MASLKDLNPNPSGSNRVIIRDKKIDLENNRRPFSSDSEEENKEQRRVDKVQEEIGPIPLFLTVNHRWPDTV